MHQPIVIGPAADAGDPSFEHAESASAKLRVHVFEQKYGRNFFFQHSARKQSVSNLHEEIEIVLSQNVAAAAPHLPAQISRIPSMRLDFFLEEPLDPGGVLGRAAVSE